MVTKFKFVQPFINFIKRDKVFHALKQSVSNYETLYDKGLYIRVSDNHL